MRIGDMVSITTRMRTHVIHSTDGFQTHHHTGVVIPNPKWLGNDYITIKDHKHDMTRMIYLNNIVKSDQVENDDNVRTFRVKDKKKGSQYILTYQDGKITCPCMGFQFRRTCRHSAAVIKHINS